MITRTISKRIESLSKNFKVLSLTGARQVGKTTLLKSLKEPQRETVSLDNSVENELALNDPNAFFTLHKTPLLIDEVQRAPSLTLKIKEIVDSDDCKNQIWLTGCQKPKLKKNVSDSLAGRVAELEMYPLFIAEKQGEPFRSSFYPAFNAVEEAKWNYRETLLNVVLGGYPELQNIREENRNDWFRSYISTYLLSDIKDEIGDIDELTFSTFLQVLAARTATGINYSAIASDVGMSAYKCKQLLSLLYECGIVFLVPPYSRNTLKSVVKTPRLHFVDSGLCCHLLGINSVEGFLAHRLRGEIF